MQRANAAVEADQQDQDELTAENYSDLLFYAGINEDDFFRAVDAGILTQSELEQGYIGDVAKMLGNIAGDETLPSPLRHVAETILDQGHDFSRVRFRIAREETDWAGLYTPGFAADSGEIAVHVDSNHVGGIAQTIVHEALHHISYYKTLPGYRLNATERSALRDIERIRQFAERVAIAKNLLPGETVTDGRARLAAAKDRSLYGLSNVDEFITEILTNPGFQTFLVERKPMQGLTKKGGLIRNLLDQVFAYLKDFIFGRDVSGDSLLTQGLDNVMALIQTPQDPAKVRETAAVVQGFLDSRASEPAAQIKLADIAEAMPIDPIAAGDTVSVPRDKYDKGRLKEAIAAAGRAFKKIFGKTVTAVDGRKILIQRAGEGIIPKSPKK